MQSLTDDEARASGFRDAADMTAYAVAMREQDLTERWTSMGAPSDLDLVDEIVQLRRRLDGSTPPPPMTVQEAAQRSSVSEKTIRRRLSEWASMTPPLAYRLGEGARSPWRVLPAALEVAPATVEPEPAKPSRGRKQTAPTKRSATRWEA
jgi:hypothetical protein